MYIAGKIFALAEIKYGQKRAGIWFKDKQPGGELALSLFSNAMTLPKKLPAILRHIWKSIVRDEEFSELLTEWEKVCDLPRKNWGDFGIGYYHLRSDYRAKNFSPAELQEQLKEDNDAYYDALVQGEFLAEVENNG